MTTNMTEGGTLPHIARFSLPLLAGNLLQQAYNIADAAIVGRRLGADALAAVGASSSVQFLVLGFCIGCCCGLSVPVAQRFGAGDFPGMRSFVFWGAVLSAAFSLLLTVPCTVFCKGILRLLSTPDDIFSGAYDYLSVIFLGIPFCVLYNLLSGILRAVGDSRTPFVFLAVSTVLNIAGDVFCIVVLDMGVRGAAVATVAAQAASGILCLVHISLRMEILHVRKSETAPDWRKVSFLLAMGVPMGLQFSITAIGSMVLQRANNSLGSLYVAAFSAAMRIKQLVACPFDALATAVSTFASQNYGAHKVERIRDGIRKGVLLGVCYGLLMGAALILCGRSLTKLFVSEQDSAVLDAAGLYLRALGFFYWPIGILNVCRMTTQGLGWSGRAILSGVMEMVARIAVSVILVPRLGFYAVCFADQCAWLSAVLYIVPTCASCVRKIGRSLEKDASPAPCGIESV